VNDPQSIVGVIGIAATLLVAALVLRIERGDRTKEKVADREAFNEETKSRKIAEEQRERRAMRREQHKEDYRIASRSLNVLEKAFEAAREKPLTREEIANAKVEEVSDDILSLGKRIQSLELAMNPVWLSAVGIMRKPFPPVTAFRYLASINGNDEATRMLYAERMSSLFMEATRSAVIQSRAAIEGLKGIEAARRVLAYEWGSEPFR
jgi:hypothetical protein